MYSRNVNRRISCLYNCERLGRVVAAAETMLASIWYWCQCYKIQISTKCVNANYCDSAQILLLASGIKKCVQKNAVWPRQKMKLNQFFHPLKSNKINKTFREKSFVCKEQLCDIGMERKTQEKLQIPVPKMPAKRPQGEKAILKSILRGFKKRKVVSLP